MTAHTPGPWTVRHRCVDTSPYDDERCGLGLEVDGPPEPHLRGRFARAAAAHLVAAAPELLAALEAVLLFHSGREWDETTRREWLRLVGAPDATTKVLCDVARAVIAKARGEADPTSEDEG